MYTLRRSGALCTRCCRCAQPHTTEHAAAETAPTEQGCSMQRAPRVRRVCAACAPRVHLLCAECVHRTHRMRSVCTVRAQRARSESPLGKPDLLAGVRAWCNGCGRSRSICTRMAPCSLQWAQWTTYQVRPCMSPDTPDPPLVQLWCGAHAPCPPHMRSACVLCAHTMPSACAPRGQSAPAYVQRVCNRGST
jgi:hypothetical protein